jgi:hypothetical protein
MIHDVAPSDHGPSGIDIASGPRAFQHIHPRLSALSNACRLKIRDTADWGRLRYQGSGSNGEPVTLLFLPRKTYRQHCREFDLNQRI